ncbi:helicase ATP-binding domain-containing protein [Pycnococcus provasolii]
MAAFRIPVLPTNAPRAPQPTVLNLPLQPHQLRTLHRCLAVERNPAFAASNFNTFLNYEVKGGCLADGVGMGKTAVILAMIVSEPADNTKGANLVVAPSHLLRQWATEASKFCGDDGVHVKVIEGVDAYVAAAKLGHVNNRTLVLVDAKDVLKQERVHYDFRKAFKLGKNRLGNDVVVEKHLDEGTRQRYKNAAVFVSQGYKGPLFVGPLFMPEQHTESGHKPWRRLVLDEVQDVCASDATYRHDIPCHPHRPYTRDAFLQLSRSATNVWLVTATPFPNGEQSAYANHALLGFKRLDLRIGKGNSVLEDDHPFEHIKRKLYVRNPERERAEVVTKNLKVEDITIDTPALSVERAVLSAVQLLEGGDGAGASSSASWPTADVILTCGHVFAQQRIQDYINFRYGSIDSWAHDAEQLLKRTLNKHKLDAAVATQKLKDTTSAVRLVEALLETHAFRQFVVYMETNRSVAIPESLVQDVLGDEPSMRTESVGWYDEPDGDMDYRIVSGYEQISEWIATNLRAHDTDSGDVKARHFLERSRRVAGRTAKLLHSTNVLVERTSKAVEILSEARARGKENDTKAFTDEERVIATRYGSKVCALRKFLLGIPKDAQAVVFSYNDEVLRRAQTCLTQAGIRVQASFAGTSDAMASAISCFSKGAEICQVLMCSSLRGAAGANLQHAKNLILMDVPGVALDSAVANETQAMGRVLRMGQTGPVQIVRFAMDGSCERSLWSTCQHARSKNSRAFEDEEAYKCEAPSITFPSVAVPSVGADEGDDDDDACVVAEVLSFDEVQERKRKAAEASGMMVDLIDGNQSSAGAGGVGFVPPSSKKPKADPERHKHRLSSQFAPPAPAGPSAANATKSVRVKDEPDECTVIE